MRPTVVLPPEQERSRLPGLFFLFEIALVALVPLLAFVGLQTVLDSTNGTFVEQLTPADPGWRAPVDPSPVTSVVITDGDRVSAVALITQPGAGANGGGIIIVPTNLVVDGFLISDRGVDDVALAVELAVQLHVSQSMVIDAAQWARALGDKTYQIDNPDPVPGEGDEILIPVGSASIGADEVGAFVGRVPEGASPLSALVRQQLWWEAVMADPPSSGADGEFEVLLSQLAAGVNDVEVLPYMTEPDGSVTYDEASGEQMLRGFVPFPVSPELGFRLRVSVLTRTTTIDPATLAIVVGRAGAEVTEIGNAAALDEGPTQLLAPRIFDDDDAELRDDVYLLAERFGADIVWTDEFDDAATVTLVAGPDIRVES